MEIDTNNTYPTIPPESNPPRPIPEENVRQEDETEKPPEPNGSAQVIDIYG